MKKNDELSKVKTKAEEMKEYIKTKNNTTIPRPDNVFLKSHRELNKFKALEKYNKEKYFFLLSLKMEKLM